MSTAQKMARRIQQYVWSLVVVVMCAPLTSAVTISAQAANKKMDGTSVFGTAATTSFPLHAFDCLWLHAFDGNAENSWTNNFSSCVCLCVCLYVCMHVCPCDCEQTYVCWMNVCLFVCYVCMYVYLQICVWVLKHTFIPTPTTHICKHTHTHEWMQVHTFSHTPRTPSLHKLILSAQWWLVSSFVLFPTARISFMSIAALCIQAIIHPEAWGQAQGDESI